MKKLTLTLLIVTLLGLFCSCSDDDNSTNTQNDDSVYLPLAVGNEWIFIKDATTEESVKISTKSEINGVTFFVFEGEDDYSFNFDHSDMGMYYKDEDLWGFKDGVGKLFLEKSPVVGSIYEVNYTSEGSKIEILDTSEEISTDLGTFKCLKFNIFSPDDGWHTTYWMAKGIGIVKRLDINSGITSYLKSYTIN